MGTKIASVYVKRSDGPGCEARWVEYQVPLEDRMTVLGVLDYIYENLDSSLAYYQSCRIGRCMGCLVVVDNKVVPSCEALAYDGMRVGPHDRFELVRDLVVDFNKRVKTAGQ